MKYLITFVILGLLGCASHNYTHYLLEPAPKIHPSLMEDASEPVQPLAHGSTSVLQVRWNNGHVLTEVAIPILHTGQRIVLEHAPGSATVASLPATRIVPPPPVAADQSLVTAYLEKGLPLHSQAPEVSLLRSRTLMQAAIKQGNYALGLEWCEGVLQRYPAHPEFLRAKASLLLLLGEKQQAIALYEHVESIESDPDVRKKLELLQSQP